MLSLIRKDGALRGLPVWVLIGVLNTSVLMAFFRWSAATRGDLRGFDWALLVSAWVAAATYLIAGPVRARCGGFQLTLPLSARRLWLSHAIATALAGAAITAVSAMLVLFEMRGLGDGLVPNVVPIGPLALLVAGVVLAVTLLQGAQSRLVRIRFTPGYALRIALVLVGVPVLLVVLRDLGPAGALVPLLLALAVGYGVLSGLPQGFSLVPLEAAAGGRVVAGEAAGTRIAAEPRAAIAARPGRWVMTWALLRGTSAGAKEWMSFPFALLFGWMVGGGLSLVSEDLDPLRYVYVPLATYMLFALAGPRLGRLHHLDPLPVARRVLFAFLVIPHLVVFGAGYALGAWSARVAPPVELVDYRGRDSTYHVMVPPSALSIAWDGHVPAIVAPWGESHAPNAVHLWRGSTPVLYSPFKAPEGSSRDFVAWQVSRAVREVYGAEIPARQIAERLETRADGTVAPKGSGLALRAGDPSLRPREPAAMIPVLVALVCVPFLFLLAGLLRAYRPGVPEKARQWLVWGALLVLISPLLVLTIGSLTDVTWPGLVQALIEIPVQRLTTSPAATAGAWGLCAVMLLGAYLLGQSQFRRMEIPSRAVCYTLIRWSREED